MNKQIEKFLTSIDVSKMIEKEHSNLMRDIRRYVEQLAEVNIELGDFFQESQYTDANNQTRPCYNVTKKGCEFIAHKLTGIKGTIFTARYINRFHEMEDIIREKQTKNWFVRRFRNQNIVLERDFIAITGVDIRKHKLFYRMEYFTGGLDWNGWGWKCNNEEFRNEYGFDYGDDDCMMYLHPCGVRKALRILESDRSVTMNVGAKELLLNGIKSVEKPAISVVPKRKKVTENVTQKPVQITIVLKQNEIETVVR